LGKLWHSDSMDYYIDKKIDRSTKKESKNLFVKEQWETRINMIYYRYTYVYIRFQEEILNRRYMCGNGFQNI
jgi:hypothetical protein